MSEQTKRYYSLKLQNNFFERDEIKIIEAMPNGKDYILFYLKIMLKSINQNGHLIFKQTIPYNNEMLSTITGTNIDIVRVAIDTFIGLGLIDKLDDGALFMSEVNKMLGSETQYAGKKREYRQEKIMSKLLEDNYKTKKDNVRQEIELNKETEKDIPYSPLKVQKSVLIGNEDGWCDFKNDWLDIINQYNYQFSKNEVVAIKAWAKYKADRNENMTLQQIELTLKQLNKHQLARQNLIYLIETSISRGYKGIMGPTKTSADITIANTKLRYLSEEYITRENKIQKIELRNYLERCYLRDKIDPRTKTNLTSEQRLILKQHFASAQKLHMSFTEYVYQEEVVTGVCLLDVMFK